MSGWKFSLNDLKNVRCQTVIIISVLIAKTLTHQLAHFPQLLKRYEYTTYIFSLFLAVHL